MFMPIRRRAKLKMVRVLQQFQCVLRLHCVCTYYIITYTIISYVSVLLIETRLAHRLEPIFIY